MTRFLVLENRNSNKNGKDTVVMFVPDNFDRKKVFDSCDLADPIIMENFIVDGVDGVWNAMEHFLNLGTYRPFTG